ncbi:MAG TPA: hypothetical protein VFE55_16310 [Acidimicrobiia bacterium]|nr:hypothetical protein [Acidimicrobiia bacterium]
MRPVAATVVAVGLLAAAALASAAPARASLPGLAAGCTLFPADNAWHADVSRLPVNPRSADWIASMGGPDRRLHPDFGPNDGGGQPYGIPYSVVAGSTSKVAVTFDYADESDPGPYPFGPSTPVEQGSDAHALVVDKDHCTLYELYAADWNGGHPTAGSGAVWDLRSGALRPNGWTSADAAGLPILPGLLRRDEVAAGDVDHAIRITAARTDRRFVWPARHQAGAAADPTLPPMGAWFRLKASFDISHFRPDTQVVLRAMQRHGLIVADNGSNWYFTGTSEPGWDTGLLDELKTIPAGAFEALDTSSLVADPNSGRVASSPPPAPATTAPPATNTTARPTATTRPAPVATTAPPGTTTTTAAASTTTSSTAPEPPAPATTSPMSAALPPPTGGARHGSDGSTSRWLWLWLAPVAAGPVGLWWGRKLRRPRRP